jgi:hypothetical protein
MTLDTPLTNTETERDVSYVIKKYYKKIGFEGEHIDLGIMLIECYSLGSKWSTVIRTSKSS